MALRTDGTTTHHEGAHEDSQTVSNLKDAVNMTT